MRTAAILALAAACLVAPSRASSVRADGQAVVLHPRTHAVVGVVRPDVATGSRTYILDPRTHQTIGIIKKK